MQFRIKVVQSLAVFALSFFLLPAATKAQHYQQTNLVSDLSNQGAAIVDPNLRNPWGLTRGAPTPANPNGSPWWIGNNNSGTSTLYNGSGNPQNFFPDPHPDSNGNGINSPFNNFVMVPPPGFAPGTQSTPTGVVFNGSPSDFLVAPGKQATFIFNIQNIGGTLFVTYAKQDGARHDPVGGPGLGFVELFSPAGHHIGHLEHGDWFNAPWGVVWTTRDFGEFSNTILVGNFRSGWIAAFNGFTHKFIGLVRNPDDSIMTIDGLWSLTFGNDGNAGPADTLFFTAGINNESDGLFGTIKPVDGLDGDEE